MDDTVHIAIPCDGDDYRFYAEVTALSARRSSSLPVVVHFIDWSVIGRDRLEHFGKWHGSAIAFSRLFLAELFPDLDWVISCDADVMFRGDIAQLWKLRDDSVAIVASQDRPLPGHPYVESHIDWYRDNGLVFKDPHSYFCDGLCLCNLKKWRVLGAQERFIELAERFGDWPSPDQMVINYVFQDDRKLLPRQWGCFSGDENDDITWTEPMAIHFVEDAPWKRSKPTHLVSDVVLQWWELAEALESGSPPRYFHARGYRGCKTMRDYAMRRSLWCLLSSLNPLLKKVPWLWMHFRNALAHPGLREDLACERYRCPGMDAAANGMAVVAKLLATDKTRPRDEFIVHGAWLPWVWWQCLLRGRANGGRTLARMPHGAYDPVRLSFHGWKKRLVGPVERWLLRRADRVLATCDAEKEWILAYEPKAKVEVLDLKKHYRFKTGKAPDISLPIHVLYLGRRHPLKGIGYLEEAIEKLNRLGVVGKSSHGNAQGDDSGPFSLRIVADAFAEEKERAWDWCDVLVLPTLSENFGLVVAEALERGKRVITTDGAPVWKGQEGVVFLDGFRDGTDERRTALLVDALHALLPC